MRRDQEDLLRRLALNDEPTVERALGAMATDVETPGLDGRTVALSRLGALIALESSAASYDWVASGALAVGATEEELVGVLAAVAPIVGWPRVSSAAAELARALGLDLDVFEPLGKGGGRPHD